MKRPDYTQAAEWPIEDDIDVQPVDHDTCIIRIGNNHMRLTWKAAANIVNAVCREMEFYMRRYMPVKEEE